MLKKAIGVALGVGFYSVSAIAEQLPEKFIGSWGGENEFADKLQEPCSKSNYDTLIRSDSTVDANNERCRILSVKSGAGLMAARASYLAGFAGTATVLARKNFGIPVFGTMAHSFIQAHDDETTAFSAFARSRPDNLVLLIDTYDTEAAARKVVKLAPHLKEQGITVRGVRLDSGV